MAILDNISFKAELYGRLNACSANLAAIQTQLTNQIAQAKSERDGLLGLVASASGDADLVSDDEQAAVDAIAQAITDGCAPYDAALDSANQSAAATLASVAQRARGGAAQQINP
jgi:hypothetical protein